MEPLWSALVHAVVSFAGMVQRNPVASTICAAAIARHIPAKIPVRPQEWWTWFRESTQEAVSQRTGTPIANGVNSQAGNV
jgi:hypothetical protein